MHPVVLDLKMNDTLHMLEYELFKSETAFRFIASFTQQTTCKYLSCKLLVAGGL